MSFYHTQYTSHTPPTDAPANFDALGISSATGSYLEPENHYRMPMPSSIDIPPVASPDSIQSPFYSPQASGSIHEQFSTPVSYGLQHESYTASPFASQTFDYVSPNVNQQLFLPAPNPIFDDAGSGSDFMSDLSSPTDSIANDHAGYFPDQYSVANNAQPAFLPAPYGPALPGEMLSFSPTDPPFLSEQQSGTRSVSPLNADRSMPPWVAYPEAFPRASSRSSSVHSRQSMSRGRVSHSGSISKLSSSSYNNLNSLINNPPAPSINPDGTVQYDCNGRKPRKWKNRKYKCSHCNLVFYDRDLDLYAKHIKKVETATHDDDPHAPTGTNASGRRFKCPDTNCPWHLIGFVRKLEQQKHHNRKHSNPTFECRFWQPNGMELFPGSGPCTTRWHADSGNRLRHERAVHGMVWSEETAVRAEEHHANNSIPYYVADHYQPATMVGFPVPAPSAVVLPPQSSSQHLPVDYAIPGGIE